ncbi:MAG: hypothetical protein V3U29_08565 [Phycisphaeraceae bacterium]
MGVDPNILIAAVVAVLAAVTVTNILRTLAAMRQHQIELYDMVRHSRRLRNDYVQAVKKRRAAFAEQMQPFAPANVLSPQDDKTTPHSGDK